MVIVRKRRGDLLILDHQHGGDRQSKDFQETTAGPLNTSEKRNLQLARYWGGGLKEYVLRWTRCCEIGSKWEPVPRS